MKIHIQAKKGQWELYDLFFLSRTINLTIYGQMLTQGRLMLKYPLLKYNQENVGRLVGKQNDNYSVGPVFYIIEAI